MIKKYDNFIGGKNLFKCFLKTLTALGLSNITPNWKITPDNFLMLFISENINIDDVKVIMKRFKQFDNIVNTIDYKHNECRLYYGIRVDGTFQYGLKTEDQNLIIGKFNLTKGIFNWMLILESPSASNLKRILIYYDFYKIKLLSLIKISMKKFNIGKYTEKSNPEINNDIVTFGYSGIGKWCGSTMEETEYQRIKNEFKNFLSKFKWSNKIQINIIAKNYWVYLIFKLK